MILLTLRGNKEALKRVEDIEKHAVDFLGRDVKKACLMIEREVKIAVTGGRRLPPIQGATPYSKDYLHVGKGKLRGSYTSKIEVHGKTIIGRIGSPLIYAGVHEFGAEIHAKNKPFLVFEPKVARKGVGHLVMVKSVTIPERAPLRKSGEHEREAIIHLFNMDIGDFLEHPK